MMQLSSSDKMSDTLLLHYSRSLAPLFDNPKLDKDLCAMLKENFAEFCSTDVRPNSSELSTFASAILYCSTNYNAGVFTVFVTNEHLCPAVVTSTNIILAKRLGWL